MGFGEKAIMRVKHATAMAQETAMSCKPAFNPFGDSIPDFLHT